MKHPIALCSLLLLPLCAPASADSVFGVYAGAGTWQQDYSGDVVSGTSTLDLEDDLGIGDKKNNTFYAAVEHGVPGLPNLRVQYVDVAISGDEVLNRSIDFNGTVFNVADPVATDMDVTQLDAILYYELLDNVVSLDIGAAARMLDGDVEIVSTAQTGRAEFKGVLPMAFVKARVDIPGTGLWLGAQAQGIGYDGDSMFDMTANIGWESKWGLGAEAGWRTVKLDLDDFDDITEANVDVDGPYLALNLHF